MNNSKELEKYPFGGRFPSEKEAQSKRQKLIRILVTPGVWMYKNRKKIIVITVVSYTLRQQPAENVMVPQASAIEVIQPNNLDPIGAQKNHNLRFAQVSNNNVYQNDRTDLNIDEVILVKDDGIVPGVDGYVPKNNPRRRHPFGRPRMRGSKSIPQNIQGLSNIPEGLKVRSFTEVDTGLNARCGNRGDQCPAPELNMKQEYQTFMQEMSKKGYDVECTQERFNELATNPQTSSIDEKSFIETKGGLQGEAQGMYKNLRRPSTKDVDLDFEIDSSMGYTHVDYKTPIDFDDLAEKKGIDVSNFPSLETVAYNMGTKIPAQKEEFCGLPGGPEAPENVLHVVNLDLIRDSNRKQIMINSVLNGAEDKDSDAAGIQFLNYL